MPDAAPSPSPARAGLDPARLARIPESFGRFVAEGQASGFQFLLARDGEIVWTAEIGHLEMERRRPLEPDSIFRIYSMTKPITSVALMMLLEDGRVRLEHEVARYLPSFANPRVFIGGTAEAPETRPASRAPTLRDLLTHTSGLTYDFYFASPVDAMYRAAQLPNLWGTDGSLAEFCDRLGGLPLLYDPGTRWHYSTAIEVVGRIVEIVTGQPLDQVFQERIFGPLGMTDTAFTLPAEKLSRLAACYEKNRVTGDVRESDPADATSPFVAGRRFLAGGGGLVGTAQDYWRFAQMLLDGGRFGGVRLLSPKTVTFMLRNHLPGNQSLRAMGDTIFSETGLDGSGFGIGGSVVLDPVLTGAPGSAGSFAWGGAANTFFWIDPLERLVCVMMTQMQPSLAFAWRPLLQTLVYAALTESRA